MIDAPNAPNYEFVIGNSIFTDWKQYFLSNGPSRISIANSRFPSDSGLLTECERRLPNGTSVNSGSGSPEGVVTAPVGSLYLRADGGAGTCLYVKGSGTGNRGWVTSARWTPGVQELSIADVKHANDNILVLCNGYVSAVYSDCFYIENGDRSSGIRVQYSGSAPVPGQNVAVKGYVQTLAGLERYINASSVTPTGLSNTIASLGMTNAALYGIGLTNGVGLNCIGLLVRVWGNVISQNGNRYTISDGSGVSAVVEMRSGSLTVGKFVCVTGAASCFANGSVVQPLVIVNDVAHVSYCN